jgi:hypothetical protein
MTINAMAKRIWIYPPIVVAVSSPITHKRMRIIAIVHNNCTPPFLDTIAILSSFRWKKVPYNIIVLCLA